MLLTASFAAAVIWNYDCMASTEQSLINRHDTDSRLVVVPSLRVTQFFDSLIEREDCVTAISSPETTILLVSAKNEDLWAKTK